MTRPSSSIINSSSPTRTHIIGIGSRHSNNRLYRLGLPLDPVSVASEIYKKP